MKVHIDVRIESEPQDGGFMGYQMINFGENAELQSAGFETISKVFTRCHELLATLKQEHAKR